MNGRPAEPDSAPDANDFQERRCRRLPDRVAAASNRRRSDREGVLRDPHPGTAVRPEPGRSCIELRKSLDEAAGRLIAGGSPLARRDSGGIDLAASGPDQRIIPFQKPFDPPAGRVPGRPQRLRQRADRAARIKGMTTGQYSPIGGFVRATVLYAREITRGDTIDRVPPRGVRAWRRLRCPACGAGTLRLPRRAA